MFEKVLSLESQNNVFLIDWLTVTIHDRTVQDVIKLLGMDDPGIAWEFTHAFRNGYPCRTTYGHISILWGADDERFYTSDEKKSASEKVRHDMGICLDLSGQGCREFETLSSLSWMDLFQSFDTDKFRCVITRMDIAYDDHTGILDLHRIALDTKERNYTSPMKKSTIYWSDDQVNNVEGLTVYIGSKSNPVMIRIYDKAAEREFDSVHWVRLEIQLRHDRAIAAWAEILKNQHIGLVAAGILRNYLCYRAPSGMDTNKSRWPVADYWDKVLLDIERVRLWISPGAPYNFSKTQQHMLFQYGQALLTISEIDGSLLPFLEACRRQYPKLNAKYQNAINELKRKPDPEEKKRMLQPGAFIDLDGTYLEYWYAADIFGE